MQDAARKLKADKDVARSRLEEERWEYWVCSNDVNWVDRIVSNPKFGRKLMDMYRYDLKLMRRRPAGDFEPVPEGGEHERNADRRGAKGVDLLHQ